jgi:defect-in-organelle-trafficking protein DotC
MNFSGKSMDIKNNKFFLGAFVFGTLTFSAIGGAYAKDKLPEVTLEPPRAMKVLQRIEAVNEGKELAEGTMPLDIRRDAVIEAALSFGARGGLSMRTYEINVELERQTGAMDKIYNFRSLLVAAPSGLLIEPPVISESIDAMIIDTDGQSAAVSDRIYNINKNAKIVTTSRDWREYLKRDWGKVKNPPDILMPQDDEERAIWKEKVAEGWKSGYAQADETFEADLARLVADFSGMVRYRKLLAQGMVSPPYANQVDRGVTGGGYQMRVGDRAIQLTGTPQLISGHDQWKPANR